MNLSLTVSLSFYCKQPQFIAVCIQDCRLCLTGIDVVLLQGCTPQARPWPDLCSQGKEVLWTESLSILLEMALRTGTQPLLLNEDLFSVIHLFIVYTVSHLGIFFYLADIVNNLKKKKAVLMPYLK